MEGVKIYPELISWRTKSQGLAAIKIRFDISGNRCGSDSIGHKIPVEFWDNVKKRVKDRYPNAALINTIIESRINQHNNFLLKRQAFHLPINREVVKQYLKSQSAFESFYEYAEQVIAEKTLKDGKQYSKDTKRRYRDEIKRMLQFREKLSFHEINLQFLEKYKLWLQNEYLKKDGTKLDINTIWKALSFIRMVYNQAIKDEIILPDNNPFKKFEVGSYAQHTEKIRYLERTDLDKLENVLRTQDMDPVTYKVGWRFLCMCVTGMRISDAMLLDEYFFNDAGDLEFKPYKTRRHGNTATIPMSSERQIRYFKESLSHKFTNTNAKTFRTTFNDSLKVLAALAGIKMNLTSHVGRHTMGSFLVDGGVETESSMAMLGVKSKKTIETYRHLKASKLKSEGEKLKKVF
jgi:integrase/recombinase XerD